MSRKFRWKRLLLFVVSAYIFTGCFLIGGGKEENNSQKSEKTEVDQTTKEEKAKKKKEGGEVKPKEKDKMPKNKVKEWGKSKKENKVAQEGESKAIGYKITNQKLKNPLTDEEAKRKLTADFKEYRKRMIASELANEEMLVFEEEDLSDVEEDFELEEAMGEFDYGWYLPELKERFPGYYKTYVVMSPEERKALLDPENARGIPINCFYVNCSTGVCFVDYGLDQIYRIPDDYKPCYTPGGYDGYNDEQHVLSILLEKGLIESKMDYYWNQEEQAGLPEEDVARIAIYHTKTDKLQGIYDVNYLDYSVTDVDSEQVIYTDPLLDYPVKEITEKNAEQEMLQFIQKLGYDVLSNRYSTEYERKEKVELLTNPFETGGEVQEVYIVAVRVQGKGGETAPVIARYAINATGTVVAEYLPNKDIYCIVYGKRMAEAALQP